MIKEGTNVDADQWPIVVIKEAHPDDIDTIKRGLVVVADLYRTNKEPYVIIMDSRKGYRPSAAQRYVLTEFRRNHKDHVETYCRGFAIVSSSAIIKAVVAAMHWIKSPDTSTKVFPDMDSAVDWANAQLKT